MKFVLHIGGHFFLKEYALIQAKRTSETSKIREGPTATVKSLRSASTLILGESPKKDPSQNGPERQTSIPSNKTNVEKLNVATPVASGLEPAIDSDLPSRAALDKYWSKFKVDKSKVQQKEMVPSAEPPEQPPAAPAHETVPDKTSIPASMHNEKCMSPAEQKKALGHAEPKKKGRPPKSAKAKAAAKAKAKARSEKKAPKAKAKSKSKRTRNNRSKANGSDALDSENENENHDASGEEDPEASGSKESKTPRANSKKAKIDTPADPPKAKAKAKAASRKPTSKGKTAANKEKSKDSTPKKEPAATNRTAEQKALLSRKSCAYKKARKQALDNGKTKEEATIAAKQVS